MYTWEGMKKISFIKALLLYCTGKICVYLLYNDDTEGMAESQLDIIRHQDEYGVEVEEWERIFLRKES